MIFWNSIVRNNVFLYLRINYWLKHLLFLVHSVKKIFMEKLKKKNYVINIIWYRVEETKIMMIFKHIIELFKKCILKIYFLSINKICLKKLLI